MCCFNALRRGRVHLFGSFIFCLTYFLALCRDVVLRGGIFGRILLILFCGKESVFFGMFAENLHTGPSINTDKLFIV